MPKARFSQRAVYRLSMFHHVDVGSNATFTQRQVAAAWLNLRPNPGVLPVTRLNARLNAA
jgi:hypothetical protein